jgi:hypothetical protein
VSAPTSNPDAPDSSTRVHRLLSRALDLGLPVEKSTVAKGCWSVILDGSMRQRMLNIYTAPNQGAEVYLIDDGIGVYDQITQARARTEMDAAADAAVAQEDS